MADLEQDWEILRPEIARCYKGRQLSFMGSAVHIEQGGVWERKLVEGPKIAWGPDTGGRIDHRAAASFLARKILFDFFCRGQVARVKAITPGFTEHVILKLAPLGWELSHILVWDMVETLEAGGIPNILEP